MGNLFLIPPETLSQTPVPEWNEIFRRDDVLFTSFSADYQINKEYFNRLNCRYFIFADFNKTGLVEKKARELHNLTPFRKIISTAEADVLRSAKLRENLSIPGHKIQDALFYRDKFRMKTKVSQHDIKVPNFKKICFASDLLNFIDEFGYDVLVQPNLGTESFNTIIIRNEGQLEELLSSGLIDSSYGFPDLIVETVLKGKMFHVDGLVIDNKLMINQPTAYIDADINFQNGIHLGSYTLANDNPLAIRLMQLNEKVIHILPSPENFAFHAEYFHDDNDNLLFCEIACRPGSGVIKDVLFEKYGINIITEWMKNEVLRIMI